MEAPGHSPAAAGLHPTVLAFLSCFSDSDIKPSTLLFFYNSGTSFAAIVYLVVEEETFSGIYDFQCGEHTQLLAVKRIIELLLDHF